MNKCHDTLIWKSRQERSSSLNECDAMGLTSRYLIKEFRNSIHWNREWKKINDYPIATSSSCFTFLFSFSDEVITKPIFKIEKVGRVLKISGPNDPNVMDLNPKVSRYFSNYDDTDSGGLKIFSKSADGKLPYRLDIYELLNRSSWRASLGISNSTSTKIKSQKYE